MQIIVNSMLKENLKKIKKILLLCVIGSILTAFIPFSIVKGWNASYVKWKQQINEYEGVISEFSDGNDIVSVLNNDEVITLDMFEYICSVVAAEMPPSYHEEALKAQAVASYSFTLYHINNLGQSQELDSAHKGAAVCTNPAHCKAYLSKTQAREKWGEEYFEKLWARVENAVSSVYKKAACFDGEPINAAFFAISAGKTEDAQDVWGNEVPYLKSVDSSFDKSYPQYMSTVKISVEEFKIKLKESIDISFTDNHKEWISDIVRSSAGGVKSLKICSAELKGSELRSILGLRSSNFEIVTNDDSFTFNVFGYGHDVGMSQTGAQYLALEGKNYEEILKWYYTGIEIIDMI